MTPNETDFQENLRAGQIALQAAAWAAARAAFARALAVLPQTDDTSPVDIAPMAAPQASAAVAASAHDGLGIALWWLNDIPAAHHHRTQAYLGFRQAGELGRAARIAAWLAREQVFLSGNVPGMMGWFQRANQLGTALPPGTDRAWLAILHASMLAGPEEMNAIAAEVVSTARAAGHGDLEAFALAFGGQAEVALGRVGQGLAHLDEAMIMATAGEVANLMTISEIFCVMLSACELAGDLARSEQWCHAGLEFARRYDCPFLLAYCRTSYGGLLSALGRWQEAEVALTEAIRTFERGHRGLRVQAVIKLAELRLSQGKLDEAGVLLAGLEDQAAAVVPLARLWWRKGEPALARALLEQGLPQQAPPDATADSLYQLPALLLLTDILLTTENADAVAPILARLTRLAEQAGSPLLSAQMAFTEGRASLHRGDYAAARASFNAALGQLRSYEQSLLAGQVRLSMAETLRASDPAGAAAWARGALATFERIGAANDAAQAAAMLRGLGIPGRAGPRLHKPLTAREAEIAALIAHGLSNREIAQRLVLSAKTVEHHVGRILSKLDLHSRAEVAALAAGGRLDRLQEGES